MARHDHNRWIKPISQADIIKASIRGYFSTAEARHVLKLPEHELHQLIHSGTLPAYKLPNDNIVILAKDVNAYMRNPVHVTLDPRIPAGPLPKIPLQYDYSLPFLGENI